MLGNKAAFVGLALLSGCTEEVFDNKCPEDQHEVESVCIPEVDKDLEAFREGCLATTLVNTKADSSGIDLTTIEGAYADRIVPSVCASYEYSSKYSSENFRFTGCYEYPQVNLLLGANDEFEASMLHIVEDTFIFGSFVIPEPQVKFSSSYLGNYTVSEHFGACAVQFVDPGTGNAFARTTDDIDEPDAQGVVMADKYFSTTWGLNTDSILTEAHDRVMIGSMEFDLLMNEVNKIWVELVVNVKDSRHEPISSPKLQE